MVSASSPWVHEGKLGNMFISFLNGMSLNSEVMEVCLAAKKKLRTTIVEADPRHTHKQSLIYQ